MNGMNRGLKESKWAPSSARIVSSEYIHLKGSKSNPLFPRKTSAEKRQSARLQAYSRCLKTLRRLKWKSTNLLFSYHRALNGDTSNVFCGVNFSITSDTGRADAAQIMFRADWFEWYLLLEKVLINLLECFGIVITPDHTTNDAPLPPSMQHLGDPPNTSSLIGDSQAFHGYAHRFHANVLAALDKPTNPLHTVFRGHVRQYLGLAKEFRNRWKEIEQERDEVDLSGLRKSYHQIVEDLQLDAMLLAILTALENARSLASQHLATIHSPREVEMINADEDEALEFPEDAMDWD